MPINKDDVGVVSVKDGTVSVADGVVSAVDGVRSAADGVRSIAEMVVQFTRRLQQVADEAFRPGTKLREFLDRLPEVQARLDELPLKTQRALSACGFPALHSFFSISDVNKVVQLFEDEGVEAARSYIEGCARDGLNSPEGRERLLSDWARNPLVASRIPILTDALEAHVNGKYSLSVPVVISQLEGLIASIRGEGEMNFPQMKSTVSSIVESERLMGAHVSTFVNSILLARFRHGDSAPFDLSRHAILHGGDVSYGTEWNSIRAIVLFDYIQAVIKE